MSFKNCAPKLNVSSLGCMVNVAVHDKTKLFLTASSNRLCFYDYRTIKTISYYNSSQTGFQDFLTLKKLYEIILKQPRYKQLQTSLDGGTLHSSSSCDLCSRVMMILVFRTNIAHSDAVSSLQQIYPVIAVAQQMITQSV